MSSGMQDIIDDLRDEIMVLSQSLQVANSERDLLRRQVYEYFAAKDSSCLACDEYLDGPCTCSDRIEKLAIAEANLIRQCVSQEGRRG